MLPAKHRLTRDRDFARVHRNGKSVFSSALKLRYADNGLAASRFGIVVSARVSKKAVERNRLKRQVREILRHFLTRIRPGKDIVIFTSNRCLSLTYQDLEEQISGLFKKAKLL